MRSLALFFVATAAFGADLTGIWVGEIGSGRPDRDPSPMAFQFAQKGAVLGGKLYGDFQSTPISSGIVAGELVTFVVVLAEQAGNEINDTKIRFTGRLISGELELTREFHPRRSKERRVLSPRTWPGFPSEAPSLNSLLALPICDTALRWQPRLNGPRLSPRCPPSRW